MSVGRPSHIPSLDGLRAVAVLFVFFAHSDLAWWMPGRFGVTVFFFLSGYLITTLLRIECDHTGTISLTAFYIRRAFRILPPFLLVFLATVTLAALGLFEGSFQVGSIAAGLLYYANYYIIRHGNGAMPHGMAVLWSLAVEEHFYLVFPLCYRLLRRALPNGRGQAEVFALTCLVILVWRCLLVYGSGASIARTLMGTDTRIDSIFWGCALAVFGNPVLDGPGRFSETTWKMLWLPASLIVLALSFLVRDERIRESVRYTVQGIALWPLFICAIRFPEWGPMRLLNWRPVALLGVISYTFYLVHSLVLEQLSRWRLGPLELNAAGLGVSVLLSWAVHLWVEGPSARMRSAMLQRRAAKGGLQVSSVAQPF